MKPNSYSTLSSASRLTGKRLAVICISLLCVCNANAENTGEFKAGAGVSSFFGSKMITATVTTKNIKNCGNQNLGQGDCKDNQSGKTKIVCVVEQQALSVANLSNKNPPFTALITVSKSPTGINLPYYVDQERLDKAKMLEVVTTGLSWEVSNACPTSVSTTINWNVLSIQSDAKK